MVLTPFNIEEVKLSLFCSFFKFSLSFEIHLKLCTLFCFSFEVLLKHSKQIRRFSYASVLGNYCKPGSFCIFINVAFYCVMSQIFINYTVNIILNNNCTNKVNITEIMVTSKKFDIAIMTLKITSNVSSQFFSGLELSGVFLTKDCKYW